MDQTGQDNLPQVAVDYIDSVIKHMKYRKSVRAEVREELTAHFADALADCQTDEEKQTAAEELIAEFGDVKLLGTLLRRAKKRCRPLWRTMVARTFQFIGICFLLLIFYIGWFFTGKPIITTNYLEMLNQQVRPVADDSQNAWPFYKQAAEKYVQYKDEDKDQKVDFSPRAISTLSEQDIQIIQQSISDNQESLDLIRQGNQKPYHWQIYGIGESENQELLAVLFPHLSGYRDLARLMCWRGVLNAEQGDFETAFNDLLEVYSFGQHLRGQNTALIEQLVAMAIEGMSTNTLRMVLSEYSEQVDLRLLNSTRERLEAVITDEDFVIDFGLEKLFMYDEVQRCFTQSRFGKSHLYLPRLSSWLSENDLDFQKHPFAVGIAAFRILFTHPDKEQTLRDAENFYSEIQEMVAMTPVSIKSQGLDIDQFCDEPVKNKSNIILSALLPVLGKVNQTAWRSRVESEATLVILAVEQYEKEHGQYPQSLDVLVDEGLLKEVPIDPFSDKPLVYKKTDGGFILYSVGYNFTDDGGVPGEYKGSNKNPQTRQWTDNGDAVFWPVELVSSQQ